MVVKYCSTFVIGASLSEPHINLDDTELVCAMPRPVVHDVI